MAFVVEFAIGIARPAFVATALRDADFLVILDAEVKGKNVATHDECAKLK